MSGLTVREIGEFGLISALQKALPASTTSGSALRLGIGDDAAVWTPEVGESVVITTDSLIEGIHFRLDWTDWRSLGHKLLAVNISDLAAMGAAPKLAVLSLGLKGSEPVTGLIEMYEGMGALAARYGVMIAGGDIVASPDRLGIHVTACGTTRSGRYLARTGAHEGDLIGVSGTLGASAAGYHLLQAMDSPTSATTADLLISAHLRPEPRVALGERLLALGATSAMDLSDGLFGDLPKILKASGFDATVDRTAIPVAAAVRALFPELWFDLATLGGEDYELLFTAPLGRWNAIQEGATSVGSTVTQIGRIEGRNPAGTLRLRETDGTLAVVTTGAFDHFR